MGHRGARKESSQKNETNGHGRHGLSSLPTPSTRWHSALSQSAGAR